MYSFRNDYSEGAHSKVLQALMETNLEQTVGYGMTAAKKLATRLPAAAASSYPAWLTVSTAWRPAVL